RSLLMTGPSTFQADPLLAIHSYIGVGGLAFGEMEARAFSLFGRPRARTMNRSRTVELCYPTFVLRFEPSLTFNECTLLPGCQALLNGEPITWDQSFLLKLSVLDSALQEGSGFIVSLACGIALSGFHDEDPSQLAIHAFARGAWDDVRLAPLSGVVT
ncbi:MAG TPA: hypothetical protein VJU61_19185, partial [Polyangiaceae bacterium]|nr:hypothetical protein [Polyangiaceae bacterium]